ncbi:MULTISPECIES: lysophospholipid acyltransferase family protein [unclassified Pseudomonas]|uniref:lysophospholipid acyltransferase family protein n=1 Tax=unclassified Pseudomonas TaxID=196821 RepID=UPI0007306266|nr:MULTISPECIES: lysophospholipid acyltransferase family protein [unclassified Pseudomonas]KSW24367.1 glycerol acyltransferase [Pseudomonas sp. ADP]OBP11206.1 glycerol acyltransferase [Pseudomonas sp. EGD-AKN5]QOF86927.1 1-acyl-sn-glycerol-3-phosphate acyltransferase [Pseudomonas sp. ADPe]
MRGAWRSARLLAVIGLGLALAAGVALLERLPGYDWTALRQSLTRWWLARLRRALPLRVKVYGELPQGPALWVSNHVSWLDIPLLGALAPLTFLSKAEVRQWPLAGWLAEKAGTLFIRRGSGDGSRLGEQIAGALQLGRSTLIFPEGTTTDGRGLRNFHGRLLAGAVQAGVPLQPVALRYLRDGEPDHLAPFIGDDDLLSHLLRLLRNDRGCVEIHLLAPLPSLGRDRAQLAQQAHAAIGTVIYGEVARDQALAA